MDLKKDIEKIIMNSKGNVGVAIKNLKTKECITINEGTVFPSASTIKLVVMCEILSKVNENKYRLDDVIKLTDGMKTGGDGILKELEPGHGFTLKEIITLMIILSDNTAANMLIDMAGMDHVNDMALKLGLKSTKLQRRMMDSAAAKAGRENFTCARDMLRILELMHEGSIINKYYSDMMLHILKRQQVGGRLNLYLPDDVVIAHKTGDLDRLEHDVGIVYLPDCTYIICVLTNGTDTNKDGREIIGKVSRIVYDAYRIDA